MAQTARADDERSSSSGGSATISTVERSADILLLLKERGGGNVGITEISGTLGLPKAAVHRILASLRSRGLVQLDEESRRYSLGVEALRIGLAYLEGLDVRKIAHPFIVELSRRTHETGTLSVPSGPHHRVYVDQVTPQRQVIMSIQVGQTNPLHRGASSRALLAFMPEQRRADYFTWWQTSDEGWSQAAEDLLREDLETIREQGWAHTVEQRIEGAASIAAPVIGYDGVPVGVLSVCGPAHRFVDAFDVNRATLLETAEMVSERCGAHDES